MQLAPSILNADYAHLGKAISLLEEYGVRTLHMDIMDGHYVPNLSFGPGLIRSLRPHTDMVFDVHLMVENPDALIPSFAEAGADIITVHPDATRHLPRTLDLIRSLGKKAGVSLNPAVTTDVLTYVWDQLDLLLLMTVNPGFGGQRYIEAVDEKIRICREEIDRRGGHILLEVDGGVKLETAVHLKELGVDLAVVGTDIFGATDPARRLAEYASVLSDRA